MSLHNSGTEATIPGILLRLNETCTSVVWSTRLRILYFSTRAAYAFPMFGKPRQIETESALYEAAIKMLMRRAHSVHEMKKALARRCEDEKLIKTVIERLKAHNYLDDARYAKQFTHARAVTRKQGQFRIARDLRGRGIPDRHIETALKESAAENDPAAMVRHRIERKLCLSRGEISERKMASL